MVTRGDSDGTRCKHGSSRCLEPTLGFTGKPWPSGGHLPGLSVLSPGRTLGFPQDVPAAGSAPQRPVPTHHTVRPRQASAAPRAHSPRCSARHTVQQRRNSSDTAVTPQGGKAWPRGLRMDTSPRAPCQGLHFLPVTGLNTQERGNKPLAPGMLWPCKTSVPASPQGHQPPSWLQDLSPLPCCSQAPSGLSHNTQVLHPFLFPEPVPPLKTRISTRVTKRKTKQEIPSYPPFS